MCLALLPAYPECLQLFCILKVICMRPDTFYRRGVTLLEIMIVVTVIAVLASIMIPNYTRSRADAQLSACKSNLKNIATSLEVYAAEHKGHYPVELTVLTVDRDQNGYMYIAAIPTCPACSKNDQYISSYTYGTEPDWYALCCCGTNHGSCELDPNYPMVNASQGLLDGLGSNTVDQNFQPNI